MSKRWKIGLGCLGTSLVLGLVLSLVLWKVALPRLVPYVDSTLVLTVETAIIEYSAKHPDEVPAVGGNEDWAKILKDRKLADIPLSRLIWKGKLSNTLLVPLKVETNADGEVIVVAAGADGTMGTDDDIDTDRARAYLEAMQDGLDNKAVPVPAAN